MDAPLVRGWGEIARCRGDKSSDVDNANVLESIGESTPVGGTGEVG
jgi:hypothetical protein